MRIFCGWLLLVIAILGCSGKKPGPVGEQANISGSVTFNDKPVTRDSHVVFFYKEKSITAAGKVDTLGKFTITPGDLGKGLPAGRYLVTISPPQPAPVEIGTEEYNKLMTSGGQTNKPAVAPPADIPMVFMAFETTPIVVEVKGGENTFDFPLDKLAKK